MNRFWIAAITIVICASAAGVASAQSKKAAKPTALIPFELERAKERGGSASGLIRLNDDVARMSATRIIEMPVVDGRMGEHARLDNLELFFPYGSVVTATAEFHKYRPALLAASDNTVPEFNPDPLYDRVKTFDSQLGRVCATEQHSDGRRTEMRISPDRVMSVVQVMPAKYAGPSSQEHPSYKVISGLEMRFLSFKEPEADRLYRQCQRPSGQKVSAAQ
ncbi:hypothetical protein FNB15_19555 [Ferrovibrio terrae]|uniref:Uncharacterized protein n=1 Tax=Ferrovibrio terrae TaxID=2594003 RepID=A0A516H6D2_9PROT|nr:hypothetical protein [Ferrovibrio terrae]QDO99336.1 hypothetical protein FNB15_19555 [Ferrovibrio terrae]